MKRIWLAGAAAALGFSAMVAPATAEDAESLLKSILKTAPKAPDAWCQRHALNETTARWRASRGETPPPAEPDPERPATCNQDYVRQLQACAAPANPADDKATALNARLKACMSELAGKGVRPAL